MATATMASDNTRETAFSMRWQALKTKAENATKELAANIQEQRDRFVRERQAEKVAAAQTTSTTSTTSMIDTEQHEEALRIVQYQNKALRDRLRSTAAENERLHEMLKEYRAAPPSRGVEDSTEDSTVSETTLSRLEQQISLLRENLSTAEHVAAKKETIYKEEIAALKASAEKAEKAFEEAKAEEAATWRARIDEMENRMDAMREEKDALSEALERVRREAINVAEVTEVTEVSESEAGKAPIERVLQENEEGGREIEALREEVGEVTAERDELRAEVERLRECDVRATELSTSLMKAQKETELLQALLDSAKEAEREANAGLERASSSSEALTEGLQAELRSVRAQLEKMSAASVAMEEQMGGMQTALEAEKSASEELRSGHAEALGAVRAEMEQIRSEMEANVVAHAAEKAKLEYRIDELVRQATTDANAASEAAASAADTYAAERAELVRVLEASVAEKAELEQRLSHAMEAMEAMEAAKTMEATTSHDQEIASLKIKLEHAERLNREAQEHKRQTAEKLDQLQSMIASGAKALEETRRLQKLLDDRNAEIASMKGSAREHREDSSSSPPPSSPAPPSYDAVLSADRDRHVNHHAVDVTYLSAVLRQSFSCGELSTDSPVFGVIARLLQFSDEEIADVLTKAKEAKAKRDGSSSLMNVPDLTSMLPGSLQGQLSSLSTSFSK